VSPVGYCERIATAVQPYLTPGEQIQAAFVSSMRQRMHPAVWVTVPIGGIIGRFVGIAVVHQLGIADGYLSSAITGGIGGAFIGVLLAPFLVSRVHLYNFVVTDRRILVLEGSVWRSTRLRGETTELRRSTRLGPPSGRTHSIPAGGETYRVSRRLFGQIRLADSLLPPKPPTAWTGTVPPVAGSSRSARFKGIAIAGAVIAGIAAASWGLYHYATESGVSTAIPAATSAPPTAAPPTRAPFLPVPGVPVDVHRVEVSSPVIVQPAAVRLSWPAYVNTTGYPGYDLARYQVSSADSPYGLIATDAGKLATVAPGQTSFTDRSITKNMTGVEDGQCHFGSTCYYRVDVLTKSGGIVRGLVQQVPLPQPGQSDLVLPAKDAFSVGSAASTAGELPVGHGTQNEEPVTGRVVFRWGSLSALPSGTRIVQARLDLACLAGGAGMSVAYQLTGDLSGRDYIGPGGSYVQVRYGYGYTGDPDPCEYDATQFVRNWSATPDGEHGLLLRERDESQSEAPLGAVAGVGGVRDGAGPNPWETPMLVITYTPGG
jgi:hypothetical protein